MILIEKTSKMKSEIRILIQRICFNLLGMYINEFSKLWHKIFFIVNSNLLDLIN